jgi:hypothetical protein
MGNVSSALSTVLCVKIKLQLACNVRIIFIFFKEAVISTVLFLVLQRTSALECVKLAQVHAIRVGNLLRIARNAEAVFSCSMEHALQIAQLTKVISAMQQLKHANFAKVHAKDAQT